MNAREAVYRSLIRIEKEGRYSALELDSVIDSESIGDKDRALYTSLLYGVTERKITLDYIISQHCDRPVKRLDLSTLIILRIGVYQICYLDRVPDSAAVNECVKLASRYSSRSKGFINAVLRKVSLGKESVLLPSEETDRIKYLSVKYSLPVWICELFTKDYPEEGEDIFSFVNSDPYITLRVNTLKTTREKVLQKLGDRAVGCRYSPFGARLTERIPISELSLDKGEYFVQDEASQIECMILDPREGETLIDVCACPGGKSFSAAIAMNNKGVVHSFDLHGSKLSLINSGAERLGISIIRPAEHDSTAVLDELEKKADRVICDVPCSGLGVLHKKSDLRYKDPKTLEELPALQYAILEASAKYLKDGGTLIYSTCTVSKAENERVVEKFIKNNPGYQLSPFKLGGEEYPGYITLLPHIHGTDGFFIAKILKNTTDCSDL